METTQRTIAVTGAASGIGRAVVETLTARGDRVIDVDRAGASVVADLADQAGRDHAVAEIRRLGEGRLDAVVACAGVNDPTTLTVRVNYFGVTRLVTALREELAASGTGRVAVVASLAATQGVDDAVVAACLADDEDAAVARSAEIVETFPHPYVLYPSSKHAVARWARRTAVAPGWADAGITVNTVGPGVVRTPMTDPLFADAAMKSVMDQAMPSPLGYAQPEDVAAMLAFLVSPEASHVTGQLIFVDSGADATTRPDVAF